MSPAARAVRLAAARAAGPLAAARRHHAEAEETGKANRYEAAGHISAAGAAALVAVAELLAGLVAQEIAVEDLADIEDQADEDRAQ